MQAVAAVRRHLNAEKIGHAGTLDPLADGILPIALGEATKLIPLLHDNLKSYRFGVNWGAATNTDDMEGEVVATSPVRPTPEQIEAVLPQFTGLIQQTPPAFSAIKINGQRSYALARAGEAVELSSREIYIDSFESIESNENQAVFQIICGTGTYVRALARDMAQLLGTCGHCGFITRTNVGRFTEEMSISLEKLQEMDYTACSTLLWPLANGLDDILAIAVTDTEATALRRGMAVRFLSKMDAARLPQSEPDGPVLALNGEDVVAICTLKGVTLQPVRVINN